MNEDIAPARRAGLRACLVVFFIAFILRLVPVGHGLPGLYVPDTHSVRNALFMLKDRDLVPRSNQYSSYPYLYSYFCLPVFVADYTVARVDGRAASSGEYQQWAAAHLDHYHFLARIVAAIGGAAAAAAACAGGGWLAGRLAGWFAGFLAAASPLVYLLSVHERPWSFELAFGTLSAAAAVRFMDTKSLRLLFISGLGAGAAAGCHQTGIFMTAIPLAAAWFATPGIAFGSIVAFVRSAVVFLRSATVAVFGVILTFLAGNPYYLVHGRSGAAKSSLDELTDMNVGGQGLKFKFDAQFLGESLTGILTIEGIVVLLGFAGMVLWIRSDRRVRALAAFAIPVFIFFLFYTGTHARYYLIVFPALWIIGGALLSRLFTNHSRVAALALLAVPLLATLRIGQLLIQTDTRNIAAEQIMEIIPAGSVVAVEPYGPAVTPSVASLQKLAAAFATDSQPSDPLTRRERLVLERNLPGGFDVMPLERYFQDAAPGGYRQCSKTAVRLFPGVNDVNSLFAAAGVQFVVSAERFPGAVRKDPLARWFADNADCVGVVEPGGAETLEALLPFEPRLGFYSLMVVDRPGPRVKIYKLRKI